MYVEDFHGAVVAFLGFHPAHADLAVRARSCHICQRKGHQYNRLLRQQRRSVFQGRKMGDR